MSENESQSFKSFYKISEKIKNDFKLIFESIPENVLEKLESNDVLWYEYFKYNSNICGNESQENSDDLISSSDFNTKKSLISRGENDGEMMPISSTSENEYIKMKKLIENYQNIYEEKTKEINDKDLLITLLKSQIESEVRNNERDQSIQSLTESFKVNFAEIKDKITEIATIKIKFKDLKNEYNIKEKEKDDLTVECGQMKENIDLLKRELKKHEENIELNKSVIYNMINKAEERDGEMKDLKDAYNVKSGENDNIRTECDQMKENIELLNREIKERDDKMELNKNIIISLKEEKKSKHDEMQELINCNEKLKEKVKEILKLNKELKNLNKDVISKKELEKLEEKCEDLDNENKHKQRELNTTKRKLKAAEEELSESKEELEERKKLIKTLKKELQETNERVGFEKETENFLKELEDLKKTHKETIQNNVELYDECEQLKKNVKEIIKELKERNTEVINKDEEIKKLKLAIIFLETNVKEVKENLKNKEVVVENMKRKIRYTESLNPKDFNEYKLLEKEVNCKSMTINEMELKIKNYEESYRVKFEECETQKKDIVRHIQELNNLKILNFNEVNVKNNPPRMTDTEKDKPDWWEKHIEA